MGLSQESVGKLIKQVTSTVELEEVLAAYTFSKYVNASNSSQVLRKLHLLTLYLRAIDLNHIVVQHYAAFAVTAYAIKTSPSPIATPPRTSIGTEAWNAARRPSRSLFKRVTSSQSSRIPMYGNARPESTAGSSENSDAEGDASSPRPRESLDEESRRLRAGTGLGGWGLLSRPPQYQSRHPHRAPGWELDTLPDYEHSV